MSSQQPPVQDQYGERPRSCRLQPWERARSRPTVATVVFSAVHTRSLRLLAAGTPAHASRACPVQSYGASLPAATNSVPG